MRKQLSGLFLPSTSKFILPPNPNKIALLKEESKPSKTPSSVFIPHRVQDTQKLIESNRCIGNTPQPIKNSEPNPLAGKVVTFLAPWEPTILDQNDTKEFSTILSCGLGGASSADGLYESFHPVSQLMSNGAKLMVYSSLTDSDRREERFRKGVPYYYDESYINLEESENFFTQVLKNRFFDKSDFLKNPKDIEKTILFGFSIGHRENKSHINFLHKKVSEALEKEGKNPKQISEYFSKIALVNIASPVNWEGRKLPKNMIEGLDNGTISPQDAENYYNEQKETQNLHSKPNLQIVREVGFRSLLDMGTSKQESDFNNFHCNQDLYRKDMFRFVRPDQRLTEMYLFGSGTVKRLLASDGYKPNKLGHNLADYSAALYNNFETISRFRELESSDDFRYLSAVNFDKRNFNRDRIPDDEDIDTLKREWDLALYSVAVEKLYQSLIDQEQKNSRG